MSTKITSIYNNLITLVESTLASYTRIPNPYAPDENPELFLRKGYGVGVGPAENTRRVICGFLSVNRSFSILLINQILTTDTNSASRGDFERLLLEDQYSLINALEVDNNLSGNAVKVMFANDSGIQFISGEKGKYILLEIQFDIEYLEQI